MCVHDACALLFLFLFFLCIDVEALDLLIVSSDDYVLFIYVDASNGILNGRRSTSESCLERTTWRVSGYPCRVSRVPWYVPAKTFMTVDRR